MAQAALVWMLIDEQTRDEHLEEFVETGQLGGTPTVIPYNPAVIQAIANNWNASK